MTEWLSRRQFSRRSFGAAVWLPAALLAQAQGPSLREDVWSDLARNRDVPVLMRWPAGSGPCGLVVYSHGLGGSREGGQVWSQAWVEAGLAVLHLQHPGSDIALWREPKPLQALREAASVKQFMARVADVRFVLREVERRQRLKQPDFARVRLDALGMAGHSFGAQTTQALAGQRFGLPGIDLLEPRFAAFAAFSPNAGQAGQSPAEKFGGIKKPFLCVTGSLDGDPFGSFKTPEPRIAVYDALPAGNKALLVLDKGDHGTLAGLKKGLELGPAAAAFLRREAASLRLEEVHHALVAVLSAAWWLAHLLGDAKAAAQLQKPANLGSGDVWRTQ